LLRLLLIVQTKLAETCEIVGVRDLRTLARCDFSSCDLWRGRALELLVAHINQLLKQYLGAIGLAEFLKRECLIVMAA